MDILIADTASGEAADLAQRLRAHGHVVHSCRSGYEPHDVACAALRGTECPLDAQAVDVAVGVGLEPSVDRLGDGEVCAIRHRIPLVLLDRPDDPLGRWAAAMAPAAQALEVISQVNAAILPEHTGQAQDTVREWLRRHELDDTAIEVEVRRRHGELLVELWIDERITERDAEGLGVYLVQCMRRIDPWAKGINVSVHDTTELIGN
ncbi:MAG: hypothetical protein ABSC30_11680 [Acidimicrobiales bacterium]|jgi:hypothetical protein